MWFCKVFCLSGFDDFVVLGYWGRSGWLGYLSIQLYLLIISYMSVVRVYIYIHVVE